MIWNRILFQSLNYVKSFLTLLCAVENIAIWGVQGLSGSLDPPLWSCIGVADTSSSFLMTQI